VHTFLKIAAVILLCAATSAQAQEQLSMPQFPAGWTEAFSRGGDQEMVEYVPPGQTQENWQKKISLEVYHDLKNLPLDTLQRRAAAQNREVCTGPVEGKFQSGVNNGYASAFWTMGCQRLNTSGMGETRYTKAIQATAGLYLLTYIWRTPAFGKAGPSIAPQDITEAMSFLTSSVVCNTALAQSPCPATK